jgi:hypothetical protein
MENWRAGLFAVGIVLIGLGGYASLDGAWKGLSLVAAGIALVLLGLSLERKPAAAAAAAEDPILVEFSGEDIDVTMPMAAVAVEEAEPTVPIVRAEPAPVAEQAPSESEPEASLPETVEEPEAAARPVEEAVAEVEDLGDAAHRHDQPMLGHSELVSHIRDYHEDVPFDGSTIQLRLLHERAHA